MSWAQSRRHAAAFGPAHRRGGPCGEPEVLARVEFDVDAADVPTEPNITVRRGLAAWRAARRGLGSSVLEASGDECGWD